MTAGRKALNIADDGARSARQCADAGDLTQLPNAVGATSRVFPLHGWR
jgi:hypothetical protein